LSKDDLKINLSVINSQINTISAEPSNKVYLKVEVKDASGFSMPNVQISLYANSNEGSVFPRKAVTDKFGEYVASYTPVNYYSKFFDPYDSTVNITAGIKGTNIKSSVKLKLIPVPVILVHGYQESSSVFDNLSEYLNSKGYSSSAVDYDSTAGIVFGSDSLDNFLNEQKNDMLKQGILVNKFNLITHSMGGLVSRYYTSSEKYIKSNNVNKIIFLSVPHRGSYLASIGEHYFADKSIEDLAPESELFSRLFLNMINRGLNPSIQVGNILSQYDEVVTPESASLDDWGIKTEIFNMGENNFTVDNILSGSIMEAPNHKSILNNTKVFERIYEMLNSDLTSPYLK
jgi:pimeloyl-ACP methyl ester carboxylesterase